jgi:uncharacterized repeat protein (TIGR02543 family)
MEIINKLDGESRSDRILYDNILKELAPKRKVWAFSSDDAHSTNAVGYSFDVMFLDTLTREAAMESMRKGTFYAVSRVDRVEGINTTTIGSATAGTDATAKALLGQAVPGIKKVTVDKAKGVITIEGENYDVIEWIADGNKIRSENKNAAGSSTIDLNDATSYTGQIFRYVRAHLKSATGIAFTQPFYVTNPNVKVTPSYAVPAGLRATEGDALSTVILPTNNWTWVDGDKTVNLYEKTYKAKFTPDDTQNYAIVDDIEVGINVTPAGLRTFNISNFGDNYYYYSRTNAAFLDEAFDMSIKTGWTDAPTPVGFGTAPSDAPIATKMADGTGSNQAGASGSRHTWTYFKKEFTIASNTDEILDISGKHKIDDALIMYINGIEVYRFNTDVSSTKIDAPVKWNDYAGNPVDKAVTLEFSVNDLPDGKIISGSGTTAMRGAASRANFKSALKTGVNVITCAVGQQGKSSSDLFFDLEMNIDMNVKRTDPPPSTYTVPAGLTATYGQNLASVSLPVGWTWEDDPTTPVGPAGTRMHKARYTPVETNKYNIVIMDVSVAVAKANPTYTEFDTDDLHATYGQTLADVKFSTNVAGVWSWELPTTPVGDAGLRTHKAKFIPADVANYNNLQGIDVQISVRKATPSYTVPAALTATYGQTLANVTLPTGWSWDSPLTTPVGNAGTQTQKATFTPTDVANYEVVSGNVNINVGKATGLTATAPATIIVPNGETAPMSFNLSNIVLDKNDCGTLTYKTETLTDNDGILKPAPTAIGALLSYTGAGKTVGTATQIITIQSQNYADINVTVTFEARIVTKINVTISGLTAGGNITYDGNGKLGVTGTATSGAYTGALVYTYAGTGITGSTATQPVTVGVYVLTVSVPVENAEYTGSETYNFSIIKKKITKPTVTNKSLVYTGGTLSAGIAADDAYIVTNGAAINAGDYTATVALKDKANHEWAGTTATTADFSLTWSIGKASYSHIPLTSTAVYGQQLKDISLSGSYVWASPSDAVGNVGTRAHNAKLKAMDAANFNVATGETSVSVTVSKATVTKPAVTNASLVYDGAAKSAGIAANTAVYTVTDDSKTNAGNYAAKVVLKDKNNYQWADGTTADLSLPWSIGKAAGTFVAIAERSATYSPTLTLSNLTLPDKYVWNAPETPLNAGNQQNFPATCTESSNHNGAAGNVVVNVAKASYSMSGITFADKSVTYTGTAQSLAIGGTLPTGVTVIYNGNGKTEAGTHTVQATFAVADAVNYSVPAPMTATLTIVKPTYAITVSGGKSDKATAAEGATVTVTANAAASGRVFDKWTTTTDGVTFASANATATTFAMPAKAVTVTATYKDGTASSTSAYTVTFNAGDGTVTLASGTTGTNGRLSSTPTPTRGGYTFDGWFQDGDKVSTSTIFSADAVINAKWTPVSYTISYTLNGGTVDPANPTSYNIETAGFALNAPAKAAYTFSGWTGSNGTTPELFVSVDYETAGGNKSYTANWTLIAYTVTFDAGAGTVTPSSAATGVGGKLASLPTPATRVGYTFSGWFLGDAKVSTSTVFSGDATIYADWTPTSYKITYTLNGGTASPANPTSYTIETAGFTLNNPTKATGTFNGWTGSNGTTPTLFVSVDYGTAGGSRNYTANWIAAAAYTITFNANGGTLSAATGKTGDNGTLATLPTVTKTGYTLDGWYTELTGGSLVTTATVFEKNATVHARWASADVSVASQGRVIPGVGIGDSVATVTPVNRVTAQLTVGPNPADKLSNSVHFFRQGKHIESATLYVYDASGNAVRKITVKDDGVGIYPNNNRSVGEWDLRDAKGRTVSAGAYLVKGVIKIAYEKRERVSLVVGVR